MEIQLSCFLVGCGWAVHIAQGHCHIFCIINYSVFQPDCYNQDAVSSLFDQIVSLLDGTLPGSKKRGEGARDLFPDVAFGG